MFVVANVLQPLIDLCDWILRFWHDDVGLSWGASIIGMTAVVRLMILPLTFRGVKGMQDMQRLAPEMQRIKERYKEDKQRQNQEIMKLYQEHRVNPLSSCLPLLLQIPFFIALFYLLRDDEFEREIEGAESFLFIPDLAEPATGGVLVALIVIYVVTQLASGMVTAISADRNQRFIIFALPFIFVPVIINFESGLLVYWITTNVWTIGQQLVVRKLFPKPEPIGGPKSDGKPGKAEKPTGAERPARAKAKAASGGGRASTASASGGNGGGRSKPPPPSPRKKKKRSGRRR
jgi:YidC/Oxa1 family membrane protein insertase